MLLYLFHISINSRCRWPILLGNVKSSLPALKRQFGEDDSACHSGFGPRSAPSWTTCSRRCRCTPVTLSSIDASMPLLASLCARTIFCAKRLKLMHKWNLCTNAKKILISLSLITIRYFTKAAGMRACGSYPLLLWITMCIRFRKTVASENWRGSWLSWCDSLLFCLVYVNQRVN